MTDNEIANMVERMIEKRDAKQDAVLLELEKENKQMWIRAIRAEAIKEFAERLKENSYPLRFVLNSEIDNLVKEMVGDE